MSTRSEVTLVSSVSPSLAQLADSIRPVMTLEQLVRAAMVAYPPDCVVLVNTWTRRVVICYPWDAGLAPLLASSTRNAILRPVGLGARTPWEQAVAPVGPEWVELLLPRPPTYTVEGVLAEWQRPELPLSLLLVSQPQREVQSYARADLGTLALASHVTPIAEFAL